ncbi:putative NAD-dependent epimerase/dehydratase [Actinomadura sp. NBRC 104425]|uniref:SDR family oxidoreductase n=1 Tax=Actinomadura sp. NBRC 104425 TaxID=3032204 RepID=UPI0024A5D357|nr:SDR family oxidoreductase [Actinomadura sp. NBRC 104425]GLZ14021.1 putative NAD-dependent epimerase/dehydratase [Actinomadura sp. NBRC 104425]
MRVFVTGASGFIGSAVVRELLDAGHQVLGLARSDRSAAAVEAAGAEVHRGDLDDLDGLRAGAAACDGVIHTAFVHDFVDDAAGGTDQFAVYAAAADKDRLAIEAMGEALAGSGRPLVVSSGTVGGSEAGVLTEDTVLSRDLPRLSEQTALPFAERGVRASAVRLPTVHGRGDHGFVPQLIRIARKRGVSGYPGDGSNHWAAVHRLDAARLFRLAVEAAPAGTRLHAVAEEGVPVREIAEAIGRGLNVPVTSVPLEAADEHFGILGLFFSRDIRASSERTRKLMDWRPERPGLIADLDEGHYFDE